MKFIKKIFIGFCLGAGSILPGISSGVICVIFGIYEKLINNIIYFFKSPINSIKFLLPLAVGGFIGFFSLGNLLNYLINLYPLQLNSIFIGLILGCLPSLFKEANKKEQFNIKNLLFFFASSFLAIVLILLESNFSSTLYSDNFSNAFLIFSGMLMSIGIVVPGVSSTLILMLLGIYNSYLFAVSNLSLSFLLPFGLGVCVGCLVFMVLIKFLFKYFYTKTFYCIIGFTFGSIFVLFPVMNTLIDYVIFLLCIVEGCLVTSSFEN